ncbi:hypothetical protein HOY82DRAFT_537144 [Tuber indicum]|nr:hypothetical protein HOY82DRAFT_537144 [Tuber indicum]
MDTHTPVDTSSTNPAHFTAMGESVITRGENPLSSETLNGNLERGLSGMASFHGVEFHHALRELVSLIRAGRSAEGEAEELDRSLKEEEAMDKGEAIMETEDQNSTVDFATAVTSETVMTGVASPNQTVNEHACLESPETDTDGKNAITSSPATTQQNVPGTPEDLDHEEADQSLVAIVKEEKAGGTQPRGFKAGAATKAESRILKPKGGGGITKKTDSKGMNIATAKDKRAGARGRKKTSIGNQRKKVVKHRTKEKNEDQDGIQQPAPPTTATNKPTNAPSYGAARERG